LGNAIKGAVTNAANNSPIAPLAFNAARAAGGYLGELCDKAKAKIEAAGGIKQIAANAIQKVTEIEKPDWLNGGTIVAAIGVAAMVIAAGALIAATGGLAAPIIAAAAIGTGLVGAATTTMGVFDMVEGATGKNKLKEKVFKDNQMAYNTVESLLVCSSVVGSSFLAPAAIAGYGLLLGAKETSLINNTSVASNNLQFGSVTKSTTKLESQMSQRGWTVDSVKNTVDKPYTTRVSTNLATGNSATVSYQKNGAYVIVDDVTNSIVQVSDARNPSSWITDSNIIDPFIP